MFLAHWSYDGLSHTIFHGEEDYMNNIAKYLKIEICTR